MRDCSGEERRLLLRQQCTSLKGCSRAGRACDLGGLPRLQCELAIVTTSYSGARRARVLVHVIIALRSGSAWRWVLKFSCARGCRDHREEPEHRCGRKTLGAGAVVHTCWALQHWVAGGETGGASAGRAKRSSEYLLLMQPGVCYSAPAQKGMIG